MAQFSYHTHLDVLRLWGRPSALARDLGVSFGTARAWFDRGNIPPRWWPQICDAAERRFDVLISCRRLAEILNDREIAA